jgi:Asp-tRNA(Asn)/Glu-tRNA(Gln) amidotransferase C subunit
MASIAQSFDVKINIIRPYITKNLSQNDLQKINQTTALKYQAQKTTSPQGALEDITTSNEEVSNYLVDSVKELDEIYDSFDDLSIQAEKDLNKIVYTYDINLAENELIANAERILFGSASGVITFAKYKKVLAFEQIINREIQERMVNNGGILDVA